MTVTIFGRLSDEPNSTQITNLLGKVVETYDDLDFVGGSNPFIDCSLICKSVLVPGGKIGDADISGLITPVNVYARGEIDGFVRAAVEITTSSLVNNANFLVSSPVGSVNNAGVAFRCSDSFIFNSSIILLESYLGQKVEISIGATAVYGLYIRNAPITYWDYATIPAEGVTNVFSTWGLASRGGDVVIRKLSTDNTALLNGGSLNLVDSKVTGYMHWVDNNTDSTQYKFTRTFLHDLAGAKTNVSVSCFKSSGELAYTVISNQSGITTGQEVEWGIITKQSCGVLDSWDYQVSNNAVTYTNLVQDPTKYATNYLPLTFVYYGYDKKRLSTTVESIDFTADSILKNYVHRELIELDPYISNSDQTLVDSLNQINNLSELYDRSKSWSSYAINCDYPDYNTQLATGDDKTLDLGALNLVVDAQASAAFVVDKNTNVLTIKSPMLSESSKFNYLKTTGFITFVNGAIADVAYEDASQKGIKFTITPSDNLNSQLNGVTVQARYKLRIRRSINGSVQYVFVPTNGRTVVALNKNETYSVNADGFLWRRVNQINVDTATQSEVSILFTRYTNLSGLGITNINPVLAESNLVTYDYNLSRLIITYNANNPTINFNSLLYALERIQSGQNPDIPGSTDQGLAMSDVIDVKNGRLVFNQSTVIRVKADDNNNPSDRPYIGVELVVEGLPSPIGILDVTNGRFFDYIQPAVGVSGPVSVDLTPVLDLVNEVKLKTDTLPLVPSSKQDVDLVAGALTAFSTQIDTRLISLSDQVLTRLSATQYEQPPTALEIAAALLSAEIYTGWSTKLVLRLMSSVLGGKTVGGVQNTSFRDVLDTKDAVVSTTDNEGNRSSILYNLED